jgi:G protein-coupled receptor Mth (Methuselah protein)
MKLLVLFSLLQLVLAKWEESCELKDTVNITEAGVGGYKDQHFNYDYKGITFSPQTFGKSNQVYENYTSNVNVDDHLRGCICKYKPCIRLCYYGDNFNEKVDGSKFEKFNISLDDFGIVRGRTCKFSSNVEDDDWSIMQNGSVKHKDLVYDYDNYCIDDDYDELSLITCDPEAIETAKNVWDRKLKKIGYEISIPFLIVTFLIYALMSPLHENAGDKCLMTYIACLCFLFIIFMIRSFNLTGSPLLCILIGYTNYFTVILCFTWQNVMCFDIWKCTR